MEMGRLRAIREVLNHLNSSKRLADIAFSAISSFLNLFISANGMLDMRALSAASSPLVPGRDTDSTSGSPSGESVDIVNDVANTVTAVVVVRSNTMTIECRFASTYF
jgi:hypothetical protein